MSNTVQIKKLLGGRLPRYTSYPTAPLFKGFSGDTYQKWLYAITDDQSLSLYIHVPYCRQLCWFCGCNMNVVNTYNPIARFVEDFEAEVSMVTSAIKAKPKVKHIHFGGGSPTVLGPEDFTKVMAIIGTHFDLSGVEELAVEMDPRTIDADKIKAYAAAGVNRASLGVQDFDPDVQEAINRIQPLEIIENSIKMLRDAGITDLNMDLIYGLPLQSIHSVTNTVRKAIELNPDRISLFSYAHVPWIKKHQQVIDETTLPDVETRLNMHTQMADTFEAAGYVSIGMDHFAKPNDAMALASKNGTLHRNFQGYTVDEADVLLGFGPSSISRLPQGYVQNITDIKPWRDSVNAETLPVQKGLEFCDNDHVFGAVIERLMCDFSVNLEEQANRFGVEIEIFASALEKLAPLVGAHVVIIDHHTITINSSYRMVVRTVASCFDQYIDTGTGKFSKVS
jgi:oxygen-independent coproporphyrinogen-3 oxidase